MIGRDDAVLLRRVQVANDAAPPCHRRPDRWLNAARWAMAWMVAANGLALVAAIVLDLPSLPALRFAWGLIGAAVMLALLDLPNWFERIDDTPAQDARAGDGGAR